MPKGRRLGLEGLRGLALTQREIEIVTSLADGMTAREIGQALFISRNTVRHHVIRIADKLGVRREKVAVVAAALRREMIR